MDKGNLHIPVSWSKKENYEDCFIALKEAGVQTSLLNQVKLDGIDYVDDWQLGGRCLDENGQLSQKCADFVKSKPYEKSNVAEVADGLAAVMFPGGVDICTSLYKKPEKWYNPGNLEAHQPARDISEYLLMSYCLDYDIPILAICRTMQLYGIICGGSIIQDLPKYYKDHDCSYNNEHDFLMYLNGEIVRGNHDVDIIDKNSFLYKAYGESVIDRPYSRHHQSVGTIDLSKAKVVATGSVKGLTTIEALERADSNVISMFLQFHPEHAVAHWVNKNPDRNYFMSYEDSMKIINYFVDCVLERQQKLNKEG